MQPYHLQTSILVKKVIMKADELKYVVGEVQESKPVYMRFYGRIDEESTRCFNDEFLWVQDYIKPSKIIISINSEGGSVLYGMGTFAIIQQCPIEVETIIEGLAASMASVLWAAGTRSYMRDYSILMIHNPFICEEGETNPDNEQTINAFQKQIETIYHKRFGLSKAKVREIMDGPEGCDGTYFDAKSAVEAGIISPECVLKTSKQICNKVKNQIEGVVEANALQKIMASINTELGNFKPLDNSSSIPNQNHIENSNSQKIMNEEQNFAFGSVCAQLGMDKGTEVNSVITRINALIEAEKKVKEIQNSYDTLKIQKEGLDAQLTNVQNELASVKNELKVYKDAEQAQRNAAIEQFVDDAISDGKIDASAKSKWVEMAQGNFEMVQATLNSIAKRDKISAQIANDPSNIDNAATGMTDAEKELAQKVEAAVGKDFQFKKLD
nr:MAG: Clp protease [Bacteriophage sp.]